MDKNPWIPIFIALTVSAIGAFCLQNLISFGNGFIIVLLIQFAIGGAMNQWLKAKAIIEMEKQYTQRLTDAAKQTLKLKCPCTNASEQIVPIRMDEPNFYKCLNCSKNISVSLDAKTAMLSEVLDIDASHDQVVRSMTAAIDEHGSDNE